MDKKIEERLINELMYLNDHIKKLQTRIEKNELLIHQDKIDFMKAELRRIRIKSLFWKKEGIE